MGEPLVSVVVGVYNKARYVAETLKSVLGQTYPNWELIVVDDCSTDGSLSEVERAVGGDGRVRIIRRERNSGHPGVARNDGVRAAKGKYVAFLDADDLWRPGKLAAQTAYMEAHPEYPLTHTKCDEIDGEGKVLRLRHGGRYPTAGDCLRELFQHCFICTSTVMVERTFGEREGWFSEAKEYRSGQDFEFFVRCARDGGVGMPEGVWTEYRNFDGTVSRNAGNWRSRPEDYLRKRLFAGRRELWGGRMTAGEMRRIAWAAAEQNAQYWRMKGEWGRAAWFVGQMMRWCPLAAGTWRQAGGVLLRRR